jgi:hypothetical protein
MNVAVTLAPGQKLVTHSGNAFFRLGLIAEDADGMRYGLTARHILEQEADPRIYDAATVQLIGYHVELQRQANSQIREFYETIGAFRIDAAAASINPADPMIVGIEVVPPGPSIGRQVCKVAPNGERTAGTNVGFGGSIQLSKQHGGTVQIFRDVVEIRFDADADQPVQDGDAGSLIVDEHGAAIGLMIAGNGAACYAAPLLPFFDRYSFKVVDRISPPERSEGEDILEGFSSDYRRALAGAEKIRTELAAATNSSLDPGKEPVPRSFLDLIEVD